jgi:hypothetical protein
LLKFIVAARREKSGERLLDKVDTRMVKGKGEGVVTGMNLYSTSNVHAPISMQHRRIFIGPELAVDQWPSDNPKHGI